MSTSTVLVLASAVCQESPGWRFTPAEAIEREHSPALNFQVKAGTLRVAWQSQELCPAPPAQHPRSATGVYLSESGWDFNYREFNSSWLPARQVKYSSRNTRMEILPFPDAVFPKGYFYILSSSVANWLEEN